MNILAIGAHPDDVEFLCAGTLALYASEGHNIYIAVATNGNVGSPTLSKSEIGKIRKNESIESCKKINAKLIWMDFDDEWLFNDKKTRLVFIDAIRESEADIMFIHNVNDYHPDHRNAGQISEDCRIPVSVRLVKTSKPFIKKIPHIFYMDNIGGVAFDPEVYVDVSSVIETKKEMLACHKSQNDWLLDLYDETPTELMLRQSKFRGLNCGYKFAEGFKQIKTYPQTGSFDLLPKVMKGGNM
tara:strand:+ start:144 stop:869 length:726 start_codon:yes stop_codon:yes gene_type:complete